MSEPIQKSLLRRWLAEAKLIVLAQPMTHRKILTLLPKSQTFGAGGRLGNCVQFLYPAKEHSTQIRRTDLAESNPSDRSQQQP